MRTLKRVLIFSLLVIPAESMLGGRVQQNKNQNASPAQQIQQTSPQGQATSSVFTLSVTGCVVRSDQGYSLKTESETYSMETDEDLSHFVNKQVKLTGFLEFPSAAPSNSNTTSTTNLRFLMITTVIGSCYSPQH